MTRAEEITHGVDTIIAATTRWQKMSESERTWLLLQLGVHTTREMSIEDLRPLAEQADMAFLPDWLRKELAAAYDLKRGTPGFYAR